ncbi:hypothetical protein Bbelb_088690 [Branchiostoma belcheri]|nr:hypothetical protein Bbelb_088690 [Branchiostoma belcheri]
MKGPDACMLLLLALAWAALNTVAGDCGEDGCLGNQLQPAGGPHPPTATFDWLPDGGEDVEEIQTRAVRYIPPGYKERFLLKSLLRQMGVAMRLPPMRKQN